MITLSSDLHDIVKRALREDQVRGDITTRMLFPKTAKAKAVIQAKQEGIVAGLPVAKYVFKQVDPKLRFKPIVRDGDRVKPGMIVAYLHGDGRSILRSERVALNFIQHLSGIATLTAQFAVTVKGVKVKILDTRKTTPGLRSLEKYAIRMGGGQNHRMNLSDGVLIKDNHIALAGSLSKAVQQAKRKAPLGFKVEVEATSLKEVEEAVSVGADIILLDNMAVSQLEEAVTRIGGRAQTEASGGINLKNVREIASTGVDFISIGALTHSAPAMDFSLEIYRGRRESL
jgi:nicotinate-nucleotide pyrophosphorylase (carboxylating)